MADETSWRSIFTSSLVGGVSNGVCSCSLDFITGLLALVPPVSLLRQPPQCDSLSVCLEDARSRAASGPARAADARVRLPSPACTRQTPDAARRALFQIDLPASSALSDPVSAAQSARPALPPYQ